MVDYFNLHMEWKNILENEYDKPSFNMTSKIIFISLVHLTVCYWNNVFLIDHVEGKDLNLKNLSDNA